MGVAIQASKSRVPWQADTGGSLRLPAGPQPSLESSESPDKSIGAIEQGRGYDLLCVRAHVHSTSTSTHIHKGLQGLHLPRRTFLNGLSL